MSKPNIHKYPSEASPETLAKYQIAVMQAAADGQPVEIQSPYCPDASRWELTSHPSWNWSDNRYRIAEPKIAKGHNPDGITEEQLGEGYRLLTEEEIVARQTYSSRLSPVVGMWIPSKKQFGDQCFGDTSGRTYRTKYPAGYFNQGLGIIEVLEQLPNPVRDLAKKHHEEQMDKPPLGWDLNFFAAHDKPWSLEQALLHAFQFSDTPEGGGFWHRVRDALLTGNPMPEVPGTVVEGRNPGRVTKEQLGEGYRLLTEEEREAIHGDESIHVERGDIEMWVSGCWLSGTDGGAESLTYRTKFPVNYFLKEARAVWDALGEIPNEKLVDLARQRMKEGKSVDTSIFLLSWSNALDHAFSWSKSPEGGEFWTSVFDEDWDALPAEYRPAKEKEKEPKTLRQLLDEELPRSIATAAFRNLRKEGKADVDAVYEENECIGNLSSYSNLLRFVWDDTPEGYMFWREVRDVLVNTEWTTKDPHDSPFPPYPETIDPATGVSLPSCGYPTYEEWFRNGLPKETADLAMANLAPHLVTSSFRPQGLNLALSCGFTWVNTPQGVEFWSNAHEAASDPRNPWPEVPEVSEIVEKKLRPWKSEEVPLPCVFRRKGPHSSLMRFTGLLSKPEGVCVGAYAGGTAPHNSQSYEKLLGEWEHSTDHGKTWEPCGTLE